MQLIVEHDLPNELVLPINYHHILQGIIYHGLERICGYGDFVHNAGYKFDNRKFRLFTFSLLQGKYRIVSGKIIFKEHISFEIRSTEALILKILKENFESKGIQYLNQKYDNVKALLMDKTIEGDEIRIKMKSPIVIYETDMESKKTYFFAPNEEEFYYRVQENFLRKYYAYSNIKVMDDIELFPLIVEEKDKYITKYKGFYICAWFGEYVLRGKRKYLDFLFQTGLGSKNAQGFGMFEPIGGEG